MAGLQASRYLGSIAERVAAPLFGSIVGVVTGDRVAALTFDDGPDPLFTPRLLDILARHSARATFFVIGERAARSPDLVKRIVAEQHELGNHSWDHPSFPGISNAEFRSQLCRTQKVLEGESRLLMRPPFGHQNMRNAVLATWLGFTTVAWTFHVEDWLSHDAETLSNKMSLKLKQGAIILLHDGRGGTSKDASSDRSATLAAVDSFLARFSDFEFVTISELLSRGKPIRRLRLRNP
jgi:peptidoglycan-N-acetylglucosamine deacetylase